MKRIAVFVFYDYEGVVDRYQEYIISELKKVSEKLIIVINGQINEAGMMALKKYSENLFVRKNVGYDAGAYADIIVEYIGKEELKNWDEIILCNDTFYGPFNGFEIIFQEMEKYNYDFWGLDRVERDFLSYIIMYFCVFGKRLLADGELYDFFYKYIYGKITCISDAFAIFEVGLNYTLRKKGYLYGTYSFCEGRFSKNDPEICVERYSLPVWKKKFFSDSFNYSKCIYLLNHIKSKYKYDTSMIVENVRRLYGYDIFEMYDNEQTTITNLYSIPTIKESDVLSFINQYETVYIYGAGSFARAIYFIFGAYIRNFNGFIVSKLSNDETIFGFTVRQYIDIPRDSGVIIALNHRNSSQVFQNIKDTNRCLFLWDKNTLSNYEE